MCGNLLSSSNLVKAYMSGVITMSRSPAGSVPKPEQGHLALINIWISYISESGWQAMSNVFQDDIILYQPQQSCVVCGSQ